MKNNIAISIKNLTKFYNGFKALDKINFDVKEKEFFGFLGPNGAGKTTTINSITGLSNFNSGKVEVFGNDVVKDYREARKLIGLAPQEFNFDPFLKVKEILVYQGGYYGIKTNICKKRATELLKYFDLYKKRNTKAQKLSGGQKRRLTIARALIHKPKILILDEPTAGMDVESRHNLWKFLRKINNEGSTIFLTTHYIEEAEMLCDRIGVIHKGSIIEIDKKVDLIKKFAKSTISITLNKKIHKIPEDFKKYSVSLNKSFEKLIFLENKSKLNGIMDVLRKNNLKIIDINIDEDNLEDIFLKLTR